MRRIPRSVHRQVKEIADRQAAEGKRALLALLTTDSDLFRFAAPGDGVAVKEAVRRGDHARVIALAPRLRALWNDRRSRDATTDEGGVPLPDVGRTDAEVRASVRAAGLAVLGVGEDGVDEGGEDCGGGEW